MYAYIDESGDNGKSKRSSKYFIFGIVLSQNQNTIKRIIQRTTKKFKRLRNGMSPLHAYKESYQVHKFLITEILFSNDLKLICILNNKKSTEPQIENFEIIKEKLGADCKIIFSQRETNKQMNLKFMEILLTKFRNSSMSRPHKTIELQLPDFFAWVCHRHFEKNDSELFNLIKDKVEIIKP